MRAWLLVATLLSACGSDGPPAATHRFAIDAMTLPVTNPQVIDFGDDLDGNGSVDNRLGQCLAFFQTAGGDVTSHAHDMIGSGILASSVVIEAHDLVNDGDVHIAYAGSDSEPGTLFGATFSDGALRSNRSGSSAPGTATLHLPIFVDIDPTVLHAQDVEIDLEPDGNAGYVGLVRGAIAADEVDAAVVAGVSAMLAANPGHHVTLAGNLDANNNGMIEPAEIGDNSLIASLTAPDLTLHDGTPALSFGFQIHLVPCESGTCATAPFDTCFDRVLDGNETGLDCGGICNRCPADAPCHVAGDCQSNACFSDMRCDAPTCTDHYQDGFESGFDCGGIACPACP